MFYKQLLHADIRKRKKTVTLSVCFALSGSMHAKAACSTLGKLTLGSRIEPILPYKATH